ncbi:MAG: ATP-binding protein [Patescibacteria group bacterium]|jgi:signal transduction histidine kinase
MDILGNLDLLSVGLTVLVSLLLGAIVFLSDRKSITSKSFFFFIIMVSIWGALNYLSYHVFIPEIGLWVLRLVIFFALWQVYFLFQFFLVFPETNYEFSRLYKLLLFPITVVVSLLTLTPAVFKRAIAVSSNGIITKIENGPAILLFGLFSAGFVLASIIVFIRKIITTKEKRKRVALFLVLIGTIITFILVIFFNFLLPALFSNSHFIVYGSVFYFPFILLTSFAIIKYHLLDIKIISTEVLVFILAFPVLVEVVSAETLIIRIYKFFVFLLILSSGLLLIRSVRKEVEQRERLQALTSQLQTANIQLKELDRQKTDFLSIAAHQLRTPLSITNGYIELLKDGAYGGVTKEAAEVYKNIDESNGHLVKLVDSFLDITRLEQGRTKYDFAPHDINDVIDSAVKELDVKAKQKNLTLVWNRAPELAKVIFDEEKIRHVVFNFIDNAIKYCDVGVIKVEAISEGDGVSIRVKDGGLGFEKIDEANFFQKFYRGNNVKGVNVNGTGLGLFVCAKFIESHHGRVWAHSPGLGKGSEFGFWIPVHQV